MPFDIERKIEKKKGRCSICIDLIIYANKNLHVIYK